MRYLALAVPALLLAVTPACSKKKTSESGGVSDTSISVTTPPAEAPVEARDYTFDQRQGFAQSIRSQLAGLDGQIAQLSQEAKSKGGAVSDRALERIRAARKVVDRNLSKVDKVSADNWDELKLNTNQSVQDVAEAVEGAMPK